MVIRNDGSHPLPLRYFRFVHVKFLLLIPMFALLLSNVPIKVEVSAVESPANGGCSNDAAGTMNCSLKQKRKLCCQSKESACVYFYCFQFIAPAASFAAFVFSSP